MYHLSTRSLLTGDARWFTLVRMPATSNMYEVAPKVDAIIEGRTTPIRCDELCRAVGLDPANRFDCQIVGSLLRSYGWHRGRGVERGEVAPGEEPRRFTYYSPAPWRRNGARVR